jgi:sec-independent protein translocase protein TatB
MFMEHGAVELIFLAAIALIVVGPKDLPVLMRKVGKFTAKVRGMAAEFRASFDELARQSELDELRKEVEDLRKYHYSQHVIEPMESQLRAIHTDLEADLHEGEIAPSLLPAAEPAVSSSSGEDPRTDALAEPVGTQERKA